MASRGARSLFQLHHAVRLAALKDLALAARPLYFDAIVGECISQTEVQPGVVLRQKAGSTLNLSRDPSATHEYIDTGANGVAIARHSGTFHQQPGF